MVHFAEGCDTKMVGMEPNWSPTLKSPPFKKIGGPNARIQREVFVIVASRTKLHLSPSKSGKIEKNMSALSLKPLCLPISD